MLVLDFEGLLGVCQEDQAWKRERKQCVFKGSEIHKSLGLLHRGIVMAPEKDNAMDIKETCSGGTCDPLPWRFHRYLCSVSSPLSCTGFLVMNDIERCWMTTGLWACDTTIQPGQVHMLNTGITEESGISNFKKKSKK